MTETRIWAIGCATSRRSAKGETPSGGSRSASSDTLLNDTAAERGLMPDGALGVEG